MSLEDYEIDYYHDQANIMRDKLRLLSLQTRMLKAFGSVIEKQFEKIFDTEGEQNDSRQWH